MSKIKRMGFITLIVIATLLSPTRFVGDVWAQSKARANLTIDTENLRIYRFDTFDAQRLATEAGPLSDRRALGGAARRYSFQLIPASGAQ